MSDCCAAAAKCILHDVLRFCAAACPLDGKPQKGIIIPHDSGFKFFRQHGMITTLLLFIMMEGVFRLHQ